jgi:heme-degrading monooxygenase HmoA
LHYRFDPAVFPSILFAVCRASGGHVIARIWHGWTKPEDASEYESHLRPELLPGVSKMEGFRGSYLLRRTSRDEVEFVTILLWDSIEGIKTLAGPDYETAVIPEERKKYLKRFDTRAAHYQVVEKRG